MYLLSCRSYEEIERMARANPELSFLDRRIPRTSPAMVVDNLISDHSVFYNGDILVIGDIDVKGWIDARGRIYAGGDITVGGRLSGVDIMVGGAIKALSIQSNKSIKAGGGIYAKQEVSAWDGEIRTFYNLKADWITAGDSVVAFLDISVNKQISANGNIIGRYIRGPCVASGASVERKNKIMGEVLQFQSNLI